MKPSLIASVAAIACLVTGCGLAYQSNRTALLKSASLSDWGLEPPSDHWTVEEEFVRRRLKDPDSARFSHGSVTRDAIPAGDIISGETKAQLVWVSSLGVNAKNSYGGYVGERIYYFAWKDGKMIGVNEPEVSSSGGVMYVSWIILK